MKILHTVEFYYPSIGGAQEVVRHLSERMVQAGHDVTVATTALPNRTSLEHNGVKIVEFNISGNQVNGIVGEVDKYQKFLTTQKFDVVMNYAAQQWTVDALFPVIDKISAHKIFVPCGYSALYDPAYANYFEKLPSILRKYDATVYLSEDYRDINFAREHKLKNITIIPNGADENEFTEPVSPERERQLRAKYGIGGLMLMTVGNYTGEKGHLELLSVFKKLPVAKATLVSAGTYKPHDGCFDAFEAEAITINNSKKQIGKRIVMVDGAARHDIKDLLKCADLFVFFSNIECSPLVLFEAVAAGTPFLASSAGNNSEIAKWTGAGKIVKCHDRPNGRVLVDKPDALWQLTKLAHNPLLRSKMSAHGKAAWEENYTWQKLTEKYLDLYKSVQKKGSKK